MKHKINFSLLLKFCKLAYYTFNFEVDNFNNYHICKNYDTNTVEIISIRINNKYSKLFDRKINE